MHLQRKHSMPTLAYTIEYRKVEMETSNVAEMHIFNSVSG